MKKFLLAVPFVALVGCGGIEQGPECIKLCDSVQFYNQACNANLSCYGSYVCNENECSQSNNYMTQEEFNEHGMLSFCNHSGKTGCIRIMIYNQIETYKDKR